MTAIPGMPEQLERAAAGTDPRGWLTWAAPLPNDLQRAEDSTAVADKDRRRLFKPRGHQRPATDTERALLSHLGYDPLPDELTTHVSWPSQSCRRRVWPQLEQEA
jgi:hypothetical protein